MTLQKPKIGESCNGCGICCNIQICNTGALLLRKVKYLGEKTIKGKCPALMEQADGKFGCGFLISPGRFIRSKYRDEVIKRTVSKLIGAGTWCDELGNEEDPLEEMKLSNLMENIKHDPVWREEITKAVELLQKF